MRVIYLDCGQKKYDLATFLEELSRTHQKEYWSLLALIDRTAKYGLVWNNYKTKRLQGSHAQPICEFCSQKSARVFWFLDNSNDKLIVCTHGFLGKGDHSHRAEIERAQNRLRLYYEYKQSMLGATNRNQLKP